MTDHTKIDAAQAGFKKLMRDQDGKKAMSEYESERAAVHARTERLRALRLARDAAEAKVPVEAPPAKKKPAKKAAKTATKKAKGAGGTLSTWLNDREKGGRNN